LGKWMPKDSLCWAIRAAWEQDDTLWIATCAKDTIPIPITGDNWGTQVVETDLTLTGDGTTGNELAVDTSNLIATKYDLTVIDTDDADADPANELQTISAGGSGPSYTIDLSDGGGAVTLESGANVTISRAANTLTINASGGVTDHGVLTGLSDDDHTQYAL